MENFNSLIETKGVLSSCVGGGFQSIHKQSEMYSNRDCRGSTPIPIESLKGHITELKPKPISIWAMPKRNHLPPMPLAECHWSHL